MINSEHAFISALALHRLVRDEAGIDLRHGIGEVALREEEHQALKTYFLSNFREPEFQCFTYANNDLALNPIYNYASNIFDDPSSLYEHSVKIARLLTDKSEHPNIKSGELFIAYISDILVEDEMLDAIAIFKSENKDGVLGVGQEADNNEINLLEGIPLTKLDKACLILNTDYEEGFKVLNIDHSNRNAEARYWRDDFLVLRARDDVYHSTADYIRMTAKFVKENSNNFNGESALEGGAMLKRSEQYLNNQESFVEEDFKKEVLKDAKAISLFEDYKDEYQETTGKKIKEEFAVSPYAVKKLSKVFKSVIKLDKNFHIYVHGDHSKITKGEDAEGRKFYTIYYDEET